MDLEAKKTALRAIPYGLYVLTAADTEGNIAAATVNWVTQASFEPPLVAVGVKTDSGAHGLIKKTKAFALNVLGKDQQGMAFTFFKPAEVDGNSISGVPFKAGETGSPILTDTFAQVECKLVDTVEKGDHSLFIGEVIAANQARALKGRPDEATLWLLDLGEKTFYGG